MTYPVTSPRAALPVAKLRVGAFRIPTDAPESDGTLEWSATTLVVVEVEAGGESGLGYTYADAGVAVCIRELVAEEIQGRDALNVPAVSAAARARLRNLGRGGMAAMAVSAVDTALWDLKAKHLGLPLVSLLGQVRAELPVYGSGGFTSYSENRLREQFVGWAAMGVTRFKMKVGREPARDHRRVRLARGAIGDGAELYVDANGAYTRSQALQFAEQFAGDFGVCWLEEPLAAGDLEGLRYLRRRAPARLEIAEGEYCADEDDFRRLLEADAADVIMPDATRCGGVSGFLRAAALCHAWHIPVSCHCAPALHLHVACATEGLRHAEYFHDHVRIEREFFDGAVEPIGGALHPDLGRPGLGLAFKWQDAARYQI